MLKTLSVNPSPKHNKMKKAVLNYIDAYNNFNIDGLLADLDEQIVFENINDGETNLTISDRAAGVTCCLASVHAIDGSKCDSIIKPCISKSSAF